MQANQNPMNNFANHQNFNNQQYFPGPVMNNPNPNNINFNSYGDTPINNPPMMPPGDAVYATNTTIPNQQIPTQN